MTFINKDATIWYALAEIKIVKTEFRADDFNDCSLLYTVRAISGFHIKVVTKHFLGTQLVVIQITTQCLYQGNKARAFYVLFNIESDRALLHSPLDIQWNPLNQTG